MNNILPCARGFPLASSALAQCFMSFWNVDLEFVVWTETRRKKKSTGERAVVVVISILNELKCFCRGHTTYCNMTVFSREMLSHECNRAPCWHINVLLKSHASLQKVLSIGDHLLFKSKQLWSSRIHFFHLNMKSNLRDSLDKDIKCYFIVKCIFFFYLFRQTSFPQKYNVYNEVRFFF